MTRKDKGPRLFIVATVAALIGTFMVLDSHVSAQDAPRTDCATSVKEVDDLLDQLATTDESIGRLKQRIGDNESAQKTAEEKTKAFLADQEILRNNQSLARKTKADIKSLADKIFDPVDEKCLSSLKQRAELIDKLEKTSQLAGSEEQLMDTDKADTHLQEEVNRDRATSQKIKAEIHDLVARCCISSVSERPQTPAQRTRPLSQYELKLFELALGYQYQRAPEEQAKNLNGVNGQVFFDFAQRIGIGGDFAWTTAPDRLGTTTDVTLHRFTGLVGPQIKSRLFFFGPTEHTRDKGLSQGRGIVLSFQPLFGFVHDSTKFQSSTISTSSASTAFMMSFGVNMDVMLKKNFGIRPIDFAYQPTHFGGQWQSNWKFGAGVAFRFGKEKELPTW